MKKIQLGSSGLMVSQLCLGTMTFSTSDEGGCNMWGLPTASRDDSLEMMNAFRDAGGNFIDTADVYGPNSSEEVVGMWLGAQDDRDAFVVATKVGGAAGKAGRGLSRKNIMSGVGKSLKRLGLEKIDLYQAHVWDGETKMEETLVAFDDVVRGGYADYIGLSNWTGAQITQAVYMAKALGLNIPWASLQPQYSLLCRETEHELIPVAQEHGMAILPWSPLKGGWLTGKFTRGMDAPAEGSRVEWAERAGWSATSFSSLANEKTWGVIDALTGIAEELDTSPAAVALRWLMQQSGTVIPIVGAKRMEHLVSNLQAASISLSDDHMSSLTFASSIDLPYPYFLQAE